MAQSTIAKPITSDVRTDPATKAIAERLDVQYHRIFQVVGTIQTVMKLLDAQCEAHDISDELTVPFSALSLAVDTLEDIAEQLEPPALLKQEVAHV
jgi:hypothetical protein